MKKALMVKEELERFLAVKMFAYSKSIMAVTVTPVDLGGEDWNWEVSKITGYITPAELDAIERKIIRPLQKHIDLMDGSVSEPGESDRKD
ncbi:MAG: hypothetical protein E6Q98_05215 [Rhodospirillaceae bacterium]|nr:MAG: hypothetical protein E6Q98_05215 [Rhodospirillaceae bacterium]